MTSPTPRPIECRPGTLTAVAERASDVDLEPVQHSALEVLLNSTLHEAELSAIGSHFLSTELHASLDANASILATPSSGEAIPQVVVAGLPRSGTTLLHSLLAIDHRLRSLSAPEALYPFDPVGQGRRRARERRAAALRMSPQLATLHLPAVDGPEECNVLTAHSLVSWQYVTCLNVPTYRAWLEEADWRWALRWQLELLHRLGSASPWLLKSPFHGIYARQLLAEWPEAVVVHVHRRIPDVLDSWLRLLSAVRAVYSSTAGLTSDEERMWRSQFFAQDATANELSRHSPERVMVVSYDQLVGDPGRVCSAILDRIGLSTDAFFGKAVADFVVRDPLRESGAG